MFPWEAMFQTATHIVGGKCRLIRHRSKATMGHTAPHWRACASPARIDSSDMSGALAPLSTLTLYFMFTCPSKSSEVPANRLAASVPSVVNKQASLTPGDRPGCAHILSSSSSNPSAHMSDKKAIAAQLDRLALYPATPPETASPDSPTPSLGLPVPVSGVDKIIAEIHNYIFSRVEVEEEWWCISLSPDEFKAFEARREAEGDYRWPK